MELSDLEVFRTVVATGGISRAAEYLHRVPSNVTTRIQKLEHELKKQLFVREKTDYASPQREAIIRVCRSNLGSGTRSEG
jgi:DNA-binding transcriptional LysR family regulator